MGIAFVSASGVDANDTTGTVVVTTPAAGAAGDLLLCYIYQFASAAVTPPAGWTAEGSRVDGAKKLWLFSRITVSGEPASHTFTYTAGSGAIVGASCGRWSGNGQSGYNGGFGTNNGTSTAPTVGSILTTQDNTRSAAFFWNDSGNTCTLLSVPTGFTQRDLQNNGAVSLRCIADKDFAASGSEAGSWSFTTTPSQTWVAFGFVITAGIAGPMVIFSD